MICECAGVVKRDRLKICWLYAYEGSNPFTRIQNYYKLIIIQLRMKKIKRSIFRFLWVLFLLIAILVVLANLNSMSGNVVYNGLVSSDELSKVQFDEKTNNLGIFLGVAVSLLIVVSVFLRFRS